MNEEYWRGNLEEVNIPKVMELYDDYKSAYEFFDDLFMDMVDYWGSPKITIEEYDNLVEAIKVGQKALGLGGELEALNPPEKFLNERSGLCENVYFILNIKRQFDSHPGRVYFNPDDYNLNPDNYLPLNGRGF